MNALVAFLAILAAAAQTSALKCNVGMSILMKDEKGLPTSGGPPLTEVSAANGEVCMTFVAVAYDSKDAVVQKLATLINSNSTGCEGIKTQANKKFPTNTTVGISSMAYTDVTCCNTDLCNKMPTLSFSHGASLLVNSALVFAGALAYMAL